MTETDGSNVRATAQSPLMPFADAKRMAAPFSKVAVQNTSRTNPHIVIDRKMLGHEIAAGGVANDIEMLNDDIEEMENTPNHPLKISRSAPRHAPADPLAGQVAQPVGKGKG